MSPPTTPQDAVERGTLRSGSFELAYSIEGNGTPTLVIGSARYYPRTFSSALRRSLKLIFVDHRGFALSSSQDVPTSEYSLETLLADIDRVRKHLGLDSVIIMGHSGHGYMALEYAKKYSQHVSHVVLIATGPSLSAAHHQMAEQVWQEAVCPERKARLESDLQLLPAELAASPEKRFITFCLRLGAKSWYDPTFDASAMWEGVHVNMPMFDHVFGEVFRDIDITKGLAELDRPVFLALGRFDYLVPPYSAWAPYRKSFRDLTVRVFDRSSHTPQFEESALFDAELLQWLASRQRAAPARKPESTAANLLPGVSSSKISTSRLGTHLLSSGAPDGQPVVFLHGNVSSSRFFEETLVAMPPRYRCLAPDFRGYGGSDRAPIDATRGLRDFSDDLFALLKHPQALSPKRKVHLVGWSAGGGVAMQFAIDHPELVASLTLIAPVSPYGFGGTKGLEGTPCRPDFAGSGGGSANPEFVKRLRAQDTSEESPFSPRQVMNQFYFKPPFRVPRAREDVLVSAMLDMAVEDGTYPGDSVASPHWPGVAPGARGMNNALSGRYCNLTPFVELSSRPPVLWIRGADDQIVSDTSLFDFGQLGKLGLVPGWPGEAVFPPQPMVGQTRAVFESYRARGGSVREEVLPGVGHSPHLEAPEAFRALLLGFLEGLAP